MNFQKKSMKVITMILPKGKSAKLTEELHHKGFNMGDFHHARGYFVAGPTDKKGNPVESEQEVATIVVPQHQADEIFAELFETTGVNTDGGGFMFMETLEMSVPYVLPNIKEEAAV